MVDAMAHALRLHLQIPWLAGGIAGNLYPQYRLFIAATLRPTEMHSLARLRFVICRRVAGGIPRSSCTVFSMRGILLPLLLAFFYRFIHCFL